MDAIETVFAQDQYPDFVLADADECPYSLGELHDLHIGQETLEKRKLCPDAESLQELEQFSAPFVVGNVIDNEDTPVANHDQRIR